MLKSALCICAKDLRLVFSRSAGLSQALLLGLLLVFLFSLSLDAGDALSPQAAATMFWLASAFCLVLTFNILYSLEETNQARQALLLLPSPVQAVWLGKALAGLALLLTAQCLFIPSTFVFLAQSPAGPLGPALAGLALTDLGMAACGSLMGSAAVGQGGKESLASVLLFPLLTPLLLAGIRLTATGLGAPLADPNAVWQWLELAAGFDAVFLGLGLLLFGFIYRGDD